MPEEIITAGIDIGSSSAQAVIVKNNRIIAYSNMNAGINKTDTACRAIEAALNGTGISMEDIKYAVGTGYGRYQVPFADKNVTEITCHARGAHYFFSEARTVLDMGGQDCKAISCDESGTVTNFVIMTNARREPAEPWKSSRSFLTSPSKTSAQCLWISAKNHRK